MARGLFRIAATLALAGVVGVGGWAIATGWRPAAARYPLQGVDLDERSRDIEWGSVRAAGADFAYIVATSGADRRAATFERDWAALPEAGLRRGAVHVYSLCQRADDQANAFNTFVPRSDDALPATVDIAFHDDCATRPDRADLVSGLRRFVTMVESHTGKPMLLRIHRDVEARYQLSGAIARPLWAVGNFLRPGYLARPWQLWRASDIRRIDGVEGPVNWDVVTP